MKLPILAAAMALLTALPAFAQRNAPHREPNAKEERAKRKKAQAKKENAPTQAPASDKTDKNEKKPDPAPADKVPVPQPWQHKGPQGCQYYGELACAECLAFWAAQGDKRNNHFCKDKSRANGTKGWDCFNFAEDTSHGYECTAYCPPDTPTCKSNCDQKLKDGSPWHDHPLRETTNKHTGRILGPPGSAPEPHKGREARDKCNW